MKNSDPEYFFGSKQDREILAANADLEEKVSKEADKAATSAGGSGRLAPAVSVPLPEQPAQTGLKASATQTGVVGGETTVVTTLPPVKTKVPYRTGNWS